LLLGSAVACGLSLKGTAGDAGVESDAGVDAGGAIETDADPDAGDPAVDDDSGVIITVDAGDDSSPCVAHHDSGCGPAPCCGTDQCKSISKEDYCVTAPAECSTKRGTPCIDAQECCKGRTYCGSSSQTCLDCKNLFESCSSDTQCCGGNCQHHGCIAIGRGTYDCCR
jgi:hypothetical protein